MGINSCISEAFIQSGYDIPVTQEEVFIPDLSIWITANVNYFKQDEQNTTFQTRLLLRVRHEHFFPEGLFEYAYGSGTSQEEAVIDAVKKWIAFEFLALLDFLSAKEKQKSPIITFYTAPNLPNEDKKTEWHVYSGPILYSKTNHSFSDLAIDSFFNVLKENLINDILIKKGVYPLKCLIVYYADEKIEIDCRINGEHWEKGKKTLETFAKSWNLEGQFHWRKQFMIISNY